MAAAFSVLFAAPLGSALFALEILHRRGMQYYEALVPAIVGSLSGYIVLSRVVGNAAPRPVWHIPGIDRLHRTDLLWAAGAGVVGAGIAVGFTYLTLGLAARVAACCRRACARSSADSGSRRSRSGRRTR